NNGIYSAGLRSVDAVSGTNHVAVIKPVMVRSVNGPALTVIRGVRSDDDTLAVRCVYLTNDASLSGFTLTNGGLAGAGIWFGSRSAMASNCVLTGNGTTYSPGGARG